MMSRLFVFFFNLECGKDSVFPNKSSCSRSFFLKKSLPGNSDLECFVTSNKGSQSCETLFA